MKTLGASMIVKNESKDIRACLESIKELDEIVIVDTGSTDDTVAICKQYTSDIYFDEWKDDFSYARNISLCHCTADFVLIIDADERLVTPVKQIKRLINEFWFRKYFGLFFQVQMAYEIFDSPRLFKNIDEISYINAAHNVPTWRGNADELVKRLYKSQFVIESGYSDAHRLDPDRTFRILTKNLEKHPGDTRTIYYLAREHINRKEIKEAVKLFEMYRDMKLNSVELWDNELADALYLLALCYSDTEIWSEQRWFDAVQAAMWSHAVLPTVKDTCEFLEKCFRQMPGSIDKAIRTQKLTADFWNAARVKANDAGILMKRSFNGQT